LISAISQTKTIEDEEVSFLRSFMSPLIFSYECMTMLHVKSFQCYLNVTVLRISQPYLPAHEYPVFTLEFFHKNHL